MLFALQFRGKWLLVGEEDGRLKPFGLLPPGLTMGKALVKTLRGLPALQMEHIPEEEVREWAGEAGRWLTSPALIAHLLDGLPAGDPLGGLVKMLSVDA